MALRSARDTGTRVIIKAETGVKQSKPRYTRGFPGSLWEAGEGRQGWHGKPTLPRCLDFRTGRDYAPVIPFVGACYRRPRKLTQGLEHVSTRAPSPLPPALPITKCVAVGRV